MSQAILSRLNNYEDGGELWRLETNVIRYYNLQHTVKTYEQILVGPQLCNDKNIREVITALTAEMRDLKDSILEYMKHQNITSIKLANFTLRLTGENFSICSKAVREGAE